MIVAYIVCKLVKFLLKMMFLGSYRHKEIQVLVIVSVEYAAAPKKMPDLILVWVAAVGSRPALPAMGELHHKILHALRVLIVLFSLHW